jgi:hypothetical protein
MPEFSAHLQYDIAAEFPFIFVGVELPCGDHLGGQAKLCGGELLEQAVVLYFSLFEDEDDYFDSLVVHKIFFRSSIQVLRSGFLNTMKSGYSSLTLTKRSKDCFSISTYLSILLSASFLSLLSFE